MKNLEILKELYYIIGRSIFYHDAVTTVLFVIIPDYESVKSGAHGLYLDWQSKNVHIADDLCDMFTELVREYNELCDYEDQIEVYHTNINKVSKLCYDEQ